MPLTTLDKNTALIVIDLVKAIVPMAGEAAAPVVKNSCALVEAFRRHGLPVVLVTVDPDMPGRTEQKRNAGSLPSGWNAFIPELNRQPQDHTVTKRSWGAFIRTGLEEYLRGRGVTQVVVIGVATSIGVESTARQAYELGFNVTLAVDAMADLSPEAHANSIARIFPRLGETGSTAEVLALLEKTRA